MRFLRLLIGIYLIGILVIRVLILIIIRVVLTIICILVLSCVIICFIHCLIHSHNTLSSIYFLILLTLIILAIILLLLVISRFSAIGIILLTHLSKIIYGPIINVCSIIYTMRKLETHLNVLKYQQIGF
jgi:hypothetical protein